MNYTQVFNLYDKSPKNCRFIYTFSCFAFIARNFKTLLKNFFLLVIESSFNNV